MEVSGGDEPIWGPEKKGRGCRSTPHPVTGRRDKSKTPKDDIMSRERGTGSGVIRASLGERLETFHR